MGSPLVALWRTRSIQWLLIRRELKRRYGSSALGYFWTVLDPLATCLVFWLVFGLILGGTRGVNSPSPYIVFLIVGYLPWQAISGSINGSAKALVRESKLVRSTNLPRELWVLRVVGAKMVELALALPVLILFMVMLRKGVTTGIVYLPLAVLLTVVSVTGIGLALSAVAVLYEDITRLVRIVVRLLFYMTPILYPSSKVIEAVDDRAGLEWVATVYFLNPFVTIIDLYRTALWTDQFPGWNYVGLASGVSLLLLLIGTLVFRRLEGAVLKEI